LISFSEVCISRNMTIAKRTLRTPEDVAGAEAVRAKYAVLMDERRELLSKLLENTTALENAAFAGKFFGIEIQLPKDMEPSAYQAARMEARQPTLFETPTDGTIRDMVLEQLKAAGERGTRAAPIRAHIEKVLGRELHYKTVGMTLYRLSERGQARREGFTWYFVPLDEAEKKNPAS